MWPANSLFSGRNAIKWSEYKTESQTMQQMKGVVCFMREELSIFVFADHYTEQSKGSGWEHRRSITPV